MKRVSLVAKKFGCVGFVATLAVAGLHSCSSDQEETNLESPEPVTAEESSKPEPAAPVAAESTPSSSAPESSVPAEASAGQAAPAPAAVYQDATGRRVLYVKSNGAVLRERADAKSKVLGKLQKGDHFLVTIEGEWARTDDGKFISMQSLSDKGIGRSKKKSTWSAPSGGSGAQVAPAPNKKAAKAEKKKATKSAPTTVAPTSAAPKDAPAPAQPTPAPAAKATEAAKPEQGSDTMEEVVE